MRPFKFGPGVKVISLHSDDACDIHAQDTVGFLIYLGIVFMGSIESMCGESFRDTSVELLVEHGA